MSEENKNGNTSGWLPNFNHILLVLLAGTLIISQDPFHHARPNKPESTVPETRWVDARPWQDTFEAVEKYLSKQPPEKTAEKSTGGKPMI